MRRPPDEHEVATLAEKLIVHGAGARIASQTDRSFPTSPDLIKQDVADAFLVAEAFLRERGLRRERAAEAVINEINKINRARGSRQKTTRKKGKR